MSLRFESGSFSQWIDLSVSLMYLLVFTNDSLTEPWINFLLCQILNELGTVFVINGILKIIIIIIYLKAILSLKPKASGFLVYFCLQAYLSIWGISVYLVIALSTYTVLQCLKIQYFIWPCIDWSTHIMLWNFNSTLISKTLSIPYLQQGKDSQNHLQLWS